MNHDMHDTMKKTGHWLDHIKRGWIAIDPRSKKVYWFGTKPEFYRIGSTWARTGTLCLCGTGTDDACELSAIKNLRLPKYDRPEEAMWSTQKLRELLCV